MRRFRTLAALAALMLLSATGCATVISDTTPRVQVTSDPPGAAVFVKGHKYGTTPTNVTVPIDDPRVTVRHELHGERCVTLDTELNPVVFLDILFWPSFFVDLATGAYHSLASKDVYFDFRAGPAGTPCDEKLRDDDAFTEARSGNNLDGMPSYLASYPEGRHADEAKKIFAASRLEDDRSFERAVSENTLEAIEAYRESHSGGPHADEARQLAGRLRDDLAFRQATSLKTVEGMTAYLKSFPDGRHAEDARGFVAAWLQAFRSPPAKRLQVTVEASNDDHTTTLPCLESVRSAVAEHQVEVFADPAEPGDAAVIFRINTRGLSAQYGGFGGMGGQSHTTGASVDGSLVVTRKGASYTIPFGHTIPTPNSIQVSRPAGQVSGGAWIGSTPYREAYDTAIAPALATLVALLYGGQDPFLTSTSQPSDLLPATTGSGR
jgi:hypothetical protein